ncbi:Odorant receptor 72, partial [Frankliniella occidentalis]
VEYCSNRQTAMQSELLRVSICMDSTFADMIPHLLVVVVILPLLSTVEVVANGMQADMFALGTAPLIFTVFVPLCLVGDSLFKCRRAVATRAARGPWLEETPQLRRLRLGMIHSALGRGARLRGNGVGPLDRRTCGNALRSWFSFLQILLNVKRSGDSV